MHKLQEVLEATKPEILRSDNFFIDSFFLAVITDWNNLDKNIRNSSSINVLKKAIEIYQTRTRLIISIIPKE